MHIRRKNKEIKMNAIVLALAMLCLLWLSNASATDRYFEDGIRAFNNDDHVNTVKNLYTYFELNKKTNTTQANRELLNAINYAETEIYIALKTKKELDEHGKVTEVTIENSGKMDSYKPQEICFNPTGGRIVTKPKAPKLEKKYKKEILTNKHKDKVIGTINSPDHDKFVHNIPPSICDEKTSSCSKIISELRRKVARYERQLQRIKEGN